MRVTGTGVDLFTMQSARVGPPLPLPAAQYDQVSTKFTLRLRRVRAAPGVRPCTKDSFRCPAMFAQGDTPPRLKTGLHQATLALAEAIPGPQDVELELLMEMYYMVPAHNCLS